MAEVTSLDFFADTAENRGSEKLLLRRRTAASSSAVATAGRGPSTSAASATRPAATARSAPAHTNGATCYRLFCQTAEKRKENEKKSKISHMQKAVSLYKHPLHTRLSNCKIRF